MKVNSRNTNCTPFSPEEGGPALRLPRVVLGRRVHLPQEALAGLHYEGVAVLVVAGDGAVGGAGDGAGGQAGGPRGAKGDPQVGGDDVRAVHVDGLGQGQGQEQGQQGFGSHGCYCETGFV